MAEAVFYSAEPFEIYALGRALEIKANIARWENSSGGVLAHRQGAQSEAAWNRSCSYRFD